MPPKGHKIGCVCSFCNKSGKNNPMFGRKHTDESLLKMRDSKMADKNPFYKRKHTEEYKTKMSEIMKTRSCWYKGGITELRQLIRNLDENKYWQMSVFSRDNFTCQGCGCRGHYIEAHHKKSFAKIFEEFLQKYSQFSPIDDKETLVRLSLSYEEFWDVDNGETQCKRCHKKITYERKRNGKV